MKIKVTIKDKCDLFEAISKAAPIGASSVRRLIKGREAKVNGVRVGENVELRSGDKVECFVPQFFMGDAPTVIYEDRNVLIADKPALIEVEPTLKDMLKGQNAFFEPVHRIDRNTLGLVAFAKNEEAYKALTEEIKAHRAIKRYLALVMGAPKEGEYIAYLKKDAANSLCRISPTPQDGYKRIVTVIEKVHRKGEISLVEVRLITGRTHQIRAHLAYLGYPVLGDGKYGDERCRKYGSHQKLCAYELIFTGLSGEMSYLNEKVFNSKQKIID